VVDHQMRATAWGLLLVPAVPMIVISLFWGKGRHGSPGANLWVSNPTVAAGLLGGGLLLAAIMVLGIVHQIRARNRHKALLAAYGVVVNDAGERRASG
jgi:hypothetical protein